MPNLKKSERLIKEYQKKLSQKNFLAVKSCLVELLQFMHTATPASELADFQTPHRRSALFASLNDILADSVKHVGKLFPQNLSINSDTFIKQVTALKACANEDIFSDKVKQILGNLLQALGVQLSQDQELNARPKVPSTGDTSESKRQKSTPAAESNASVPQATPSAPQQETQQTEQLTLATEIEALKATVLRHQAEIRELNERNQYLTAFSTNATTAVVQLQKQVGASNVTNELSGIRNTISLLTQQVNKVVENLQQCQQNDVSNEKRTKLCETLLARLNNMLMFMQGQVSTILVQPAPSHLQASPSTPRKSSTGNNNMRRHAPASSAATSGAAPSSLASQLAASGGALFSPAIPPARPSTALATPQAASSSSAAPRSSAAQDSLLLLPVVTTVTQPTARVP